MKYAYRYIILLAVAALALAGCSKHTVIPDKDLERITREMFLTNAVAQQQHIHTDSLDVYTPILERYGYTQEDFFNTLANFQKRKSARLSDIIESSIASLESLSEGLERKLRNLAYVDSLAKAECSKEVLWVEKIKVNGFKDTTKLHLTFPIIDRGEYVVSYNYLIDTLDKNLRLQSNHAIYDNQGRRLHLTRNNLQREVRKSYTSIIKPKAGAVEYRLTLADYTRREDEPHISFDSIRVVYLPPSEVALARMDSVLSFRPMLYTNDTIRAYGYLDARIPMLAHDTVWIALDSTELAEAKQLRHEADSLDGRAEEIVGEVEKLLSRSTRLQTKAQKEWYRNDSLRQVAHAKNLVKAEELRREADSLEGWSRSLTENASLRRLRADSIDIVIFGAPTLPATEQTNNKE
ncbi:MAG: DUF4296 domain-containing protein [Tidjanibacter sp.]|nr:DUF4296 domain-containing protein [Tidjanibacter sp.]